MWPLWSRLLEALGRLRLRSPTFRTVSVGDPGTPDAQGGDGWREYATPEALYRVWGPLEGSPWEPYHCVPLFAAIDRVQRNRLGPAPPPRNPRSREGDNEGTPATPLQAAPVTLPERARPGAPPPSWAVPGTWVFLDLPGPMTVEAAAWLITSAAVQPVCTFDHWPHPKGVLPAERILAELLRWAGTVAEARGRMEGEAPPLWICDSQRLGSGPGSPGEFDNRYYLDDSILPGPALLARGGIRRLVYVSWGSVDVPLLDLESYLSELLGAGVEVLHLDLRIPEGEPRPFSAPPSPRPPPRTQYRRSSAGGFGSEVPQPSSGGGGTGSSG